MRKPIPTTLAVASLTAAIVLTCGSTVAMAHTGSPKWFVRENAGKNERELTATLGLKNVSSVNPLNLYFLSKEKYILADGCKLSTIKSVAVTPGTPGKSEIGELILGECREGLVAPCTVNSASEEFKATKLNGELVYSSSGSKVDLLITASKEPFLKIKVKCEGIGTIEVLLTGSILAELPAFTYTEFPEYHFSPLIDEYETSSGATKKASLSSSVLEGEGFLENGVLFEVSGGTSSKELKAE